MPKFAPPNKNQPFSLVEPISRQNKPMRESAATVVTSTGSASLTDRDFDILLVETQLENEKLVQQWRIDKLGNRAFRR